MSILATKLGAMPTSRNDGNGAYGRPFCSFAGACGIAGFIGAHIVPAAALAQSQPLLNIMGLPSREHKVEGIAECINNGMKFGAILRLL